jgi:adenosine deaminase
VLAIVEFAPNRLGHVTCLHPELGGTQEQWDALIASKIPVGNYTLLNIKIEQITQLELKNI